MTQIWKFPVEVGIQHVRMPSDAELLALGAQGGQLVLWALVNPDAPTQIYGVLVVGTGFNVPQGWTYVATTQVGAFVWHLFTDEEITVYKGHAVGITEQETT